MSNREERRLDETVLIDNDKTVIDGQGFDVVGSAHVIVPESKDSFSILCSLDDCPTHQVLILAREIAEYARQRMVADIAESMTKTTDDVREATEIIGRILKTDRRQRG